ncbi:MAG: ammonium transporter [Bauldia sp.]
MRKLMKPALAGVALLAGPAVAWAQEVAPAAIEAVAEALPTPDPGDTAWMMVSALLVLMMIIPGLALFYGGMVRSKNVLSLLMQCTMIAAVVMLVWAFWGYSLAFGDAVSPIFGGLGKAFLSGVTPESMAPTFVPGRVIPEYVFIAFQMTFAAITAALIVGGFAERIKFFPLMVFIVLWVTAVYFPIAHMVWDSDGMMYGWGTLDFAGGTVVHINAGITGFVGAVFLGKRLGFGKDNMAPHNVPYVLIGAALLWVGWFGFNAGSNLEANGAQLAFINTFLATAAAAVAWAVVEGIAKGKASVVGAASGIVTGLVAITPAAGFVGPMGGIVLGIVAAVVCYFFVSTVKKAFGYDDSLDVFGIHAIGGIIGALGTGILNDPSLGGIGYGGLSIGAQFWIQLKSVLVTIAWSGIGSLVLYTIVNLVFGLRASPEQEREGLDYGSHGEVAYHS